MSEQFFDSLELAIVQSVETLVLLVLVHRASELHKGREISPTDASASFVTISATGTGIAQEVR